jgi:hypothetical protein
MFSPRRHREDVPIFQPTLRAVHPTLPLALAATLGGVANLSAQDAAFFESRIRPAFVKYCHECHSAESGKSRGGLRVDSREALLQGGDSGPAVVAHSLEKSLLFQAITSTDKDAQMPPKGKLPDPVIADFRRWIEMGAPDPRGT